MGQTEKADPGQWVREAMERYEGPLVSYALRFLHDLDRARDVVQDTFLRLCKQDRSKVEDHLAPWLFTVCRNRALEIIRKEKRMQPLSDERLAVTHGDHPSPDAMMALDDDKTRVMQIVETLSEREQELIRLKYQGELSYKEMSEVMGLSVSNVGVILHTAIKKIRGQMKQELRKPAIEI